MVTKAITELTSLMSVRASTKACHPQFRALHTQTEDKYALVKTRPTKQAINQLLSLRIGPKVQHSLLAPSTFPATFARYGQLAVIKKFRHTG